MDLGLLCRYGYSDWKLTPLKMSGFSASSFLEKLNKLDVTQPSIEALSLWMLHHHAHAMDAAFIWLGAIKKGVWFPPGWSYASETVDKIKFIYLASDVILRCAKRVLLPLVSLYDF